ncbi:hypothetical protein A2U01_0016946, partial [Trifolium medium]|nr:hypothetical protein [Trifolium medium]
MADNTRMKTLEAAVNNINATLQKLLEDRQSEATRMDRLEANLGSIQLNNALSGSTSNSPTQSSQPFQTRNVKLDFPRFDGSEVLNWIFKAEQFFEYYSTPDVHRLTIAAVHMEKDAVPWFQMMARNNPFQSWAAFTRALELEFGPSPYESPRAAIFKLSQTTTVSDFYSTFTHLSNRTQGLSPDAMLDCFISGLKPDIRREVIAQNPHSLSRALALAKLFEEKYNPTTNNPTHSTPTTRPFRPTQPNNMTRNPTPLLPTPNTRPNFPTPRASNVKSITLAEMQLRRAKGLCYYCDAQFSMSHKCPNKHLYLLQVDEGDNRDSELENHDITATEPPDEIEHHLSFN